MKYPAQFPTNALLFMAMCLIALLSAPTGYAAIKGPYSTDANTVFLLHLDEPATAGIATNSVPGINFIATADSTGTTPKNPTPGILGATGASGLGYNFGGCANMTYSNSVGLFADANSNLVADLDTVSVRGADAIPVNSFTDPTTGAFTLEALVKLAALPSANAEIICMDSSAAATSRPFQWRFTAANGGSIEFNKIDTASTDLIGKLPTTGQDAFVANQWFHVAVTYDGAGSVKFYWTMLDNSRTSATLLTNFSVGTLNETSGAVLTVGNENRNASGEYLNGYIDEVRISNIARAATDMAFNSSVPPIAPSINPEPADQFLGVGETLTIASHASGSSPLVYTWQMDAGTGFTNLLQQPGDTLSLPVTFDTAGNYRYIVTNIYGAATSSVAHVTVGAVFSEVYKTGFDANNVEVTDSEVEAHYKLLESADVSNYGPDAWVSTDTAEPVASGAYNYNDANSRWIFYNPNPNCTVRGSYTYRLSFLLDSAQPAGASLAGTVLTAGPLTLLLNGQPTGVVNPATAVNSTRNSFSFTLTNGFVVGLNTLDFVVDDTSGSWGTYNGLRVSALRGVGFALPAGAPTVSALPSRFVREGGKVTFAPVAQGRPPLSYQWYADGVALQGATNRTLTFNPVNTGAQGSNFKVVVSNDSGSVTSQVAALTIVPTNQPVQTTALSVRGFVGGVPLTNSISRLLQLNASDPDGDPVTFTSADSTGTNTASLSTITQSGAYLVYSCDPAFVGQDSFNVYVSDGQGGDAVLPVLVQITDLSLRISQSSVNTLRLAWPAAATAEGFKLYSTAYASGPFTNAVTAPVATEGAESALYIQPTNAALFYRLSNH